MTADGFSLDDRRNEIGANDIPDILARWPKREDGPNSWRFPIKKLTENDYSLAPGRYKPFTVTTVNHDNPADILRDILALEEQIAAKARKLLADPFTPTL